MVRNGEKWDNKLYSNMADDRPGLDYIGTHDHSLDARNRVSVPASWRVAGDEGNYYFAYAHPEGCIAVLPPVMQDELMQKAKTILQSDLQGQALLRKIFGNGFQFGCDKQGRILLPEALIKHAGIQKGVYLVGLGRNFQIWSDTRFKPEADDNLDVLQAMKALGF